MKTSLVIMAAGIGSRFGGGIKQLEPVGMHGEIIMDYSIHDAIEAGFNKIIFIIRKDIEEAFREVIGERIEAICKQLNVEIDYAFQAIDDLPKGVKLPKDRTKPWGTGQAVLACKGLIKEPFAVINADDYYGKESFFKLHDFLEEYTPEKPTDFCAAGFILKNTLSENGGVTRGVCQVNENGYLTGIDETKNIVKVGNKAAVQKEDGQEPIDENSHVSMNMWGLTPEFMEILEKGFAEFLSGLAPEDTKKEYLLPELVDHLIKNESAEVDVLETKDTWFGVTYQEDKETVMSAFKNLTEAGIYPQGLYQ
mgnify:CR=1 FL=1